MENNKNQKEYIVMTLSENGKVEELKEYLNSNLDVDITVGRGYCILMAVKNNHLDMVKFLAEETILGNLEYLVGESGTIALASINNRLEISEYLFNFWLNHPQHNEYKEAWEYGYCAAYTHQNKEIMGYYLFSEECIGYLNKDVIEESFIELYKVNDLELLKYLIFEAKLEKTEKIDEFLNNNEEKDLFNNKSKIAKKELIEYFNKSILMNKIENKLEIKNHKSLKNKI